MHSPSPVSPLIVFPTAPAQPVPAAAAGPTKRSTPAAVGAPGGAIPTAAPSVSIPPVSRKVLYIDRRARPFCHIVQNTRER
eukprot:6192910-Pleurochrysis_carterae.AAC.1